MRPWRAEAVAQPAEARPEAPPPRVVPSRWYRRRRGLLDPLPAQRSCGGLHAHLVGPIGRGNVRPRLAGAAALRAIFATLSDPYGPGRCTKCHSVERAGEETKINWLAHRETPNEHEFTKFAHIPHFSLLGEKGCLKCHVLNKNADVGSGFLHADNSLNTDPSVFESSFATMDKATCAKCHVQKAAGDSCLTCHNYHIGFHQPAVPKAPLPGADAALQRRICGRQIRNAGSSDQLLERPSRATQRSGVSDRPPLIEDPARTEELPRLG